MQEIVVNNPNIVIDAHQASGMAGGIARRGRGEKPRSEAEAVLLRQVRHIRREIDELVCSSTWAEDCLYRGANYAPDFRCSCPSCRTLYPNRRHPRPVRESDYSLDCQIETGEDPEFAEELARLRNDRPRAGSVFISGQSRPANSRRSARGRAVPGGES